MEPVRLTVQANRTEVVLQGDLSVAQTRATHRQLNQALVRGQPIYVDADKLERVDGAGAQLLLTFCRTARERRVRLEWRRVSPALVHIAQVLGLSDILGISGKSSHAASA